MDQRILKYAKSVYGKGDYTILFVRHVADIFDLPLPYRWTCELSLPSGRVVMVSAKTKRAARENLHDALRGMNGARQRRAETTLGRASRGRSSL